VISTIALRQGQKLMILVGNTAERTVTTSVRVDLDLQGQYRMRCFDSLFGEWVSTDKLFAPEELQRGIPVKIERRGFCLLDLQQEL
jgi:hypothetical protein